METPDKNLGASALLVEQQATVQKVTGSNTLAGPTPMVFK